MSNQDKSTVLIFFLALLFFIGVALVGNLNSRTFWGDEAHFYQTVIQFNQNFSIETLTNYNEMSTPLPFILFAVWGKLFGTDLFMLRLFSILIAILTLLIFHRLLLANNIDIKAAIFGTLFFMINPYVIGLSIFVFTDMTAILFLVLALLMMFKKKPMLLAVSLATAILSRQYMLFVIPPIIILALLNYYKNRDHSQMHLVWSSIVSTVPYLILIYLWGGTSPDSTFKEIYKDESFLFHPNWIVLYVSLIFLYLLPYCLKLFKTFYTNKRILICSVIISAVYFIFPVYTSKFSIDIGVETVGLAHKGFRFLGSNAFTDQIIFYLLFLLSLPIVISYFAESYNKIKSKVYDTVLLLDITLLSFLITMSFSYLCWEKYFIPIIPFLILRSSLMLKENRLDSQTD